MPPTGWGRVVRERRDTREYRRDPGDEPTVRAELPGSVTQEIPAAVLVELLAKSARPDESDGLNARQT
jgi:hypothetical protein